MEQQQQQQAVYILKMAENGQKIFDSRKRFRIDGSLENEDPEMAELLCKRIKMEHNDMDDHSIMPDEDCTLVAHFQDDDADEPIVSDDSITQVVMGVEEEVIDGNELELVQSEEVVSSLSTVAGESAVTPLEKDSEHAELDSPQDDNDESNLDILQQHMDIREPLSTLRTLLEQQLGIELTDYQFWLQNAQMLEAHKNLVDQCVQGEGLVQINVQIKADGDIKKINIVDVLKPAEEYLEVAEEHCGSPIEKLKFTTEEPKQNIIRWIVDSQFKKEQERLNIPLDPNDWSVAHVRLWLQWAVRQFNLVGLRLADWNINGKLLCQLSLSEFQAKVPLDPGDLFWTHLELLRKCKFVAVVQKPVDGQHIRGRQPRQTKLGKLPRIVGLPLNMTTDSSVMGCGNRSGNNGQIQLWQFLLELLTDKQHRNVIQWLGTEGEFKLHHPETVAHLWGQRKNKPTMNYEKLSRALRYYYDGDMIAKVHGKRFVYKFVCDLKQLLGYSASELNRLVGECARKCGSYTTGLMDAVSEMHCE